MLSAVRWSLFVGCCVLVVVCCMMFVVVVCVVRCVLAVVRCLLCVFLFVVYCLVVDLCGSLCVVR